MNKILKLVYALKTALATELPDKYKENFEDERLNTNLRRMFWFSVYVVFLQIVLNVLNIMYTQLSYVDTKVKIPVDSYVFLSLVTLAVGIVYMVLIGLVIQAKIDNRACKSFLTYSLLYLYFVLQMIFCTFSVFAHHGVNGQMALSMLIGTVPILTPRQSSITIGVSVAYTLALLLGTQWNTDAAGMTQWTKIFMSDMRAWFIIINGMMIIVSIVIYRLYASNFALISRLRDLSETDALTKLLNRRKFDEVIDFEWRRAIRQGSSLTLIIFDIDYFKKYNDTYGHPKGDECLAMVGGTLLKKFRRANEYKARYGGEEFALIMANTRIEDGIQACERLIKAIRDLGIPHSQSSAADVVTVSAGIISAVPAEDESLEDFINKADAALYEAKESGRNRYAAAK